MAGEELVAYYESLMGQLPSEGLAASKARTVVNRIIQLIENAGEALAKASCVAERSVGCKPAEAKACDTQCARIHVSANAIWTHLRPFVAEFRDGTLRLDVKDPKKGMRITAIIGRGSMEALLPAGDTRQRVEISLDSVESIMREYGLIEYTLKKLEAPLRVALANLAKCSREKQLAC
jgi:phenylalanyl-tRNA synthetase beta subunit